VTERPPSSDVSTRAPERGSRSCIFCGGQPVTKEHVWPRWAQAVVPTDFVPFEQIIEVDGHPKVEHCRNTRPFTETARIVCRPCNNGWMAQLESLAKSILVPMLAGEPAVLDQERQRVLATWALKTAIIVDHAQRPPWKPTSMPAEYRHIAQTSSPSNNVAVWLASSLEPPLYRSRLWGTNLRLAALTSERETAVYGAALMFGPICLQVFYSTAPGLVDAYSLDGRPAITMIWPYQGPFDWIERESFNEEGLAEYVSALPALLRSVVGGSADQTARSA